MTTLYVIRHGQTPWNAEGRYQGQLDPPLTELGQQQARETAAKLAALADVSFAAIYSSDLKRAHQTALPLAETLSLPVQTDARLREIHQGAWQGVLIGDIRAKWPDEIAGWESAPWEHQPPGGESLAQLQARIHEVIDALIAQHADETIAVFTHKLPIALLKIRYQGHPPDSLWSLLPANGAWEVFEA